jgi:hypothetical protein
MKFESLINKKQKMKKDILKSKNKIINDKSEFYLGFKKGVDDSFVEFVSFIDFFKRYKNNVKLLMDEQKKIWLQFIQYYETQKDNKASNYLGRYNNWLFEYIFYGINENNSDDFLSL